MALKSVIDIFFDFDAFSRTKMIESCVCMIPVFVENIQMEHC